MISTRISIPSKSNLREAILTLIGVLIISTESAAAQQPRTTPEQPLSAQLFKVNGRPAFVMMPPSSLRRRPQPWIWYAPTLPGLPDEHETWMHQKFLDAGIAVAGIDVGESFGNRTGRDYFSDFYQEMTERRGFSSRVVLLGRSRGGLMVVNWAVEHPENVAGIAGIYPVIDFRTYPGIDAAAKAYGLTSAQLAERSASQNPIERIEALAKSRVPALLIHGDMDTVVPLKENSLEFVRRYELAGARDAVRIIVAEGQGHNYWEGFFRCEELIEFAINRARNGQK